MTHHPILATVAAAVRCVALVAAALFLTLPAMAEERRAALVIGVGAYRHTAELPNPANDARDVARALESLGFNVTLEIDSDREAMRRALQAFTRTAAAADTALIYYAGHGMEADGRNWLVPSDARLEQESDVEFETISLDTVQRAVSGARGLRLVILDACRDNPLANRMRRINATRAIVRGLARIEPTGGTLVAYAARDGQAAFDGRGRNSPFTAALLSALAEPGLELGLLFRRVRDEVMMATSNQQEPFTYGSLPSRAIYLNPPRNAGVAAAVPVPVPTVAPSPSSGPGPCEGARIDWAAVAQSGSLAVLEEFRKTFADCNVYARLADERIAALGREPSRAAQPAPAPAPEGVTPPALGTPETEAALFLGATREGMRNVQRMLNELGFDAGPEDGVPGARTRSAIGAMQTRARVPSNGYLTQAGFDALRRMHSEAPVSVDGRWSLILARRPDSAYFRRNPQFRQPQGVETLHTVILEIQNGVARIERHFNTTSAIGPPELRRTNPEAIRPEFLDLTLRDGQLRFGGRIYTHNDQRNRITGTYSVPVPPRMLRNLPLRHEGRRIDAAFTLVFILRRL